MFFKSKKPLDFLAIGDITTDAFIKLQDATVTCDPVNENCTLSMRFGDKVPYESVTVVPAVGNSANASVAAARLGLQSSLLAWIGDDQNGKDCLASLQRDHVDTSLLQTGRGKKTNYHYVLSYQADRTILVNHIEYSYKLPQFEEPKVMYLSSLAPNSLTYHQEIETYLKKHLNSIFVFQPGTFQMKLGYEQLKGLYQRTNVFFCNVEEAQRILQTTDRDIKNLLREMRNRGPKIVCITDGPKGAYMYDGTTMYSVPMYPDPKPPLERTGAGDAFASTFSTFYAMGLSPEECLLRAPINSMSVVQYIGAQKGLLTRAQLEELLKNKPAGYQITRM